MYIYYCFTTAFYYCVLLLLYYCMDANKDSALDLVQYAPAVLIYVLTYIYIVH